ncbi:MAG: hypothetical protein QNK03_14455 [Myxococcota bacterium]|nr:hypothetical protein [Myxococcota bacterium]
MAEPDRERLRSELGARLGELGSPIRLLAEDVLGADDEPIDWVGVEPDGRAALALLATGPADGDLLVAGLAQRAWLEARLPDWEKLATGLGIRSELRPRLLLVAAALPRALRVAAREADAEGIRLGRFRSASADEPLRLELVELPPQPRPRAPAAPPALSIFRTGLSDEDLEISAAERANLL